MGMQNCVAASLKKKALPSYHSYGRKRVTPGTNRRWSGS